MNSEKCWLSERWHHHRTCTGRTSSPSAVLCYLWCV